MAEFTSRDLTLNLLCAQEERSNIRSGKVPLELQRHLLELGVNYFVCFVFFCQGQVCALQISHMGLLNVLQLNMDSLYYFGNSKPLTRNLNSRIRLTF